MRQEVDNFDSLLGASKLKWDRLALVMPWLVLAASLAATYQLWQHTRQNAAQVLQARFDSLVRDANGRVEQRMAVYEQMMRGVDGLLAHAGSVTRDEFRDYIARLRLKETYPGIQGVRFAPIVPLAQRDKHIAAVRKEGFPGYTIYPEGERGFYTPVIYAEPFDERNLVIFGYDTYSEPVRRTAMERARDTGQAAVTGKIRLLFETDKDAQAGFLMFLPVYKHDAPHGTVAERRANITGWVSSVFRMDDLMNGTLGNLSSDLDIEVYDGGEASDKTVMYDSNPLVQHQHPLFRNFQHISIAGHTWTTSVHSLPSFEAQVDREKPKFIAIAGIGASLLFALLTWLLVHGRALALHAARRMNRELIEREMGLRLAATVFKTVDEAVMVTSPDNRIIAVNPSFTRITGYPPDEVIDKDPKMFSSGKHPPEFFRELWETLTADGTWKGELWNRRKNGEIYVGWFSLNRVYDEKGGLTQHVAVFSDITERKIEEERIRHLAHYDLLTGLPNRTLFADRLRQAIARAQRDKAHTALMFIDLDKFKPVNDTFGHEVGDLLLKEVAKRLQDCVRGSDTASRL
ncbi:MAG: CHASE domain-containing protein, partial [Nitrosomonadales bacterium]|nr:CHASE domain-containing protein [Nitrosomonadales bacterium]